MRSRTTGADGRADGNAVRAILLQLHGRCFSKKRVRLLWHGLGFAVWWSRCIIHACASQVRFGMAEELGKKVPSAEEIIAKGKVEITVKRGGVIQRQEFVVRKGMSPAGEYPYLFIDKFVDLSELIRVAEEYQLPVTAKNGSVFPKDKTSKDFAHLLK